MVVVSILVVVRSNSNTYIIAKGMVIMTIILLHNVLMVIEV